MAGQPFSCFPLIGRYNPSDNVGCAGTSLWWLGRIAPLQRTHDQFTDALSGCHVITFEVTFERLLSAPEVE